jgi:hypothetical protein
MLIFFDGGGRALHRGQERRRLVEAAVIAQGEVKGERRVKGGMMVEHEGEVELRC